MSAVMERLAEVIHPSAFKGGFDAQVPKIVVGRRNYARRVAREIVVVLADISPDETVRSFFRAILREQPHD